MEITARITGLGEGPPWKSAGKHELLWWWSGEQGSCQTYVAATERISEPSAQKQHFNLNMFNMFNKMWTGGILGGEIWWAMSYVVGNPRLTWLCGSTGNFWYSFPATIASMTAEAETGRWTRSCAGDSHKEELSPVSVIWQKTEKLFVCLRGVAEEYGRPCRLGELIWQTECVKDGH